jgi:hypothetical protein
MDDALQCGDPIEAEGSPETSEVGPRQLGGNRDIVNSSLTSSSPTFPSSNGPSTKLKITRLIGLSW